MYKRAGEINVTSLLLWNDKQSVDISAMFVEFNVYEGIFNPTMSGVITMVDTHNLITSMPLIGEEWCSFTYKTLETEEDIQLLFKVFRISDRIVDGSKQIYKIHVISPEGYDNVAIQVSKKFNGTSDSIIKSILKDYLNSEKTVISYGAGNDISFVSPNWSPLECISFLTQKSLSKDNLKNSNFMFFETSKGFSFDSLYDLFAENPVDYFIADHNPMVKRNSTDLIPDPSDHLKRPLNWQTSLISDQVERMKLGYHRNKTYCHDLMFKTIDIYNYSTLDSWDEVTHMNEFPQFTSQSLIGEDELVTIAHEYNHSHNGFIDNQGFIHNKRIPQLSVVEIFKINMEVWGRSWLHAGDVIRFDVGKYTQTNETQLDPMYSGNYLIHSLVHRFAPSEHKISMQIIKDSVSQKI